ncbi:MAG TPA: XdhC family protein [Acidimicrobiales bacterium]|nr:XdhC family protein [Acidimicrobiales bacterium]
MRTVLEEVARWLAAGKPVALARVTEVVGSGIRPAGAAIAVTGTEVLGSASGGCVEGALVEEARLALADDGAPRTRTFGCSDDEAFDVGLTCGGLVKVLIERFDPPASGGPPTPWLDQLTHLVGSGTGAALLEVIEGPSEILGWKTVLSEASVAGAVGPGGEGVALPEALAPFGPAILEDASADLAGERSASHTYRSMTLEAQLEVTLFVDSFPSPPKMVVVGAASFTAALTSQAKLLGYHVVVCDARPVFASAARFPDADEVVVDWPDRFLGRVGAGLGPRDALCVLTHDAKFDVPAIMAALATDIGYIGVMGSRRTQEDRRRRLREAGAGDADLERLRGPVGLDLGANSPAETAVSIMAEVIAVHRGRSGGSLASARGPIHPTHASGSEGYATPFGLRAGCEAPGPGAQPGAGGPGAPAGPRPGAQEGARPASLQEN